MTRARSKKLLAFVLTLALALTQFSMLSAFAAAENNPVAQVQAYLSSLDGNAVLTRGNLEAIASILSGEEASADASAASAEAATQQEFIRTYLLAYSGMKESQFEGGPADNPCFNYVEMAQAAGLFDNWELDPTAELGVFETSDMVDAIAPACDRLRAAVTSENPEPYFVNGMAVPIFPYSTTGAYPEYIDSGDGIARFIVYVETDLDTDGDGKLDLVKTLVQLPRAAVDKGMKVATIFEARPYIEGTGSQTVPTAARTRGNNYLAANPGFSHEDLYATAPPRTPAGTTDTKTMAQNANRDEWLYSYSYSSSGDGSSSLLHPASGWNAYEDLNWYDYYLVRGFAVVETAGIGSAGSEGYASCGADIEVNAFKCVIEWLTGDRAAYSDKTSNIAIEADWSNGKVGMTGRSYAGTTQFALATSGVKGLETIVPVAGIASWYEYQNGQGLTSSDQYVTGLAWYVHSRLASPEWINNVNGLKDRYTAFSQLMRNEELDLAATYGPHWNRRDYTVENWFRDWGPSKIKTPMLIVHGANDNNVRPKQSEMMARAAESAGVPVKVLWHQGAHMTPTMPLATPGNTYAERTGSGYGNGRPFSMFCGEYTYDEILNLWFSHWLYGVDNDLDEKIPGALVLNNDTGEWDSYDSWSSPYTATLGKKNFVSPSETASVADVTYEEPYYVEDEEFPIPDVAAESDGNNSDSSAIVSAETETAAVASASSFHTFSSASGSSTWTNFLNGSNDGAYVMALELPEDLTVKGVVEVNIRAALTSIGSSAAPRLHAKLVEVAPTGKTVKYFGSNTFGSDPTYERVMSRGVWLGGGITNFGLDRFVQSSGQYREIARGWTDLRVPNAGFESYTATPRVANSELLNATHDYKIFLQPAAHTAKEGNRLVLIITSAATNGHSTAAATGNSAFELTVDADGTYAKIPSAYETSIGKDSALKLVAEGNAVTGNDLNLNTFFSPVQNSNAVDVTYTFDSSKFEFAGFTAASGVIIIGNPVVAEESGVTRVNVIAYKSDYGIENIGSLVLRPIGGEGTESDIACKASYVLKDSLGNKFIQEDFALITLDIVPESFSLIDLSNVIDWIGTTSAAADWNSKYAAWDFSKNGEIDIWDIAFVAMRVVLP